MVRTFHRPAVAVGPAAPGWGSWDWVGTALLKELDGPFDPRPFDAWEVPDANVVVVVKHPPPPGWAAESARRSALVYCPIDHYWDAAGVVADAGWLRLCARVVVHCRRLASHFAPFARTEYLDHPLKYATEIRRKFISDGPILWIGVRTNLPPLVEWVNAHPLPASLDVLTNPERPGEVPSPAEFGFRPDCEVCLYEWTPERHLALTATARAALDVKGEDFRSRHKPPAKAIDFLASGVPLALNPGSAPAEHLARLGFEACSPLDTDRWLSERYWRECREVGRRLRRLASPAAVAKSFRRIVSEVLAERQRRGPGMPPPEPPAARRYAESDAAYREARRLALAGDRAAARAAYERLLPDAPDPRVRALAHNDLACLAELDSDRNAARSALATALQLDPDCEAARTNLARLAEPELAPTEIPALPRSPEPDHTVPARGMSDASPVKVAILSLLFNWPSTGGGTVHSAELARFLSDAGYDVRHFCAHFDPWGVGQVTAPTPYPCEALNFPEPEWNAEGVRARFRAAVDAFGPDYVIITDSWNTKPLLAEAVAGYPYLLRLQALECLCPLNNVRLLPAPGGRAEQCPLHQLAQPEACARCVADRGHSSGGLHRAERGLAGVGTPGYPERLRRAFAEAEAVLVVNPLAEAMVSPYCRAVRVVTAGMDPARFPWPWPDGDPPPRAPGGLTVLFAGLVDEWMKGFRVLHEAGEKLWRRRRDFELVATADPPGRLDEFTRFVGWQSQDDLPRHVRAADILAMPTVAQEALGRTAVEAMAAGRPVVASRIGGLPFTVADGATGLLFEPGDPDDLAVKLGLLLDDAALRDRMGLAGRRRFEEHYAWPVIIERHYRPLLTPRPRR